MLKNHEAASLLKDSCDMKPERNAMFQETMKSLREYTYKVRYVPHETIEDYNATYNVICGNKHVTIGAAKELGIPLSEIWISEMWRPYEKYMLFHELREIYYRAKGSAETKLMRRLYKMDLSYGKMTLCCRNSLKNLNTWIGKPRRRKEVRLGEGK